MLVITVRIEKCRPIETKRALATAMADAIVQTLDAKPEWVTILIDEYDREN